MISLSNSFRRSPKPKALTAQTLRMPRSLFTIHHHGGEGFTRDLFAGRG